MLTLHPTVPLTQAPSTGCPGLLTLPSALQLLLPVQLAHPLTFTSVQMPCSVIILLNTVSSPFPLIHPDLSLSSFIFNFFNILFYLVMDQTDDLTLSGQVFMMLS